MELSDHAEALEKPVRTGRFATTRSIEPLIHHDDARSAIVNEACRFLAATLGQSLLSSAFCITTGGEIEGGAL